ncbi:MAG: hypothetical protein JRD00_00170 [Deltaproteobacteria bacterium]|nr:hypothetical protein [Deltaproteobacteria bacterium]
MLQGDTPTEVPLADDWQHLVGGARLEDLAVVLKTWPLPLPAAAGRFFPRA